MFHLGMDVKLLVPCLAVIDAQYMMAISCDGQVCIIFLSSALLCLRLSAGEVERENCHLMEHHLARFCVSKGNSGLEPLCISCEESLMHPFRR